MRKGISAIALQGGALRAIASESEAMSDRTFARFPYPIRAYSTFSGVPLI